MARRTARPDGGDYDDPCTRPGARIDPVAQRPHIVRPQRGTYPIVARRRDGLAPAPGWQPPTDAQTIGRGPVTFLGIFDTQPDIAPYDEVQHEAMAVTSLRGGATLRWLTPRATAWPTGGPAPVNTAAPSWGNHLGLTLYVAGIDVLPDGWERPGYPGIPPTAGTYEPAYGDLDTEAALGLAQLFARGNADAFADSAHATGAARYLARHVARPALDLLAYSGGPSAEADLVELAGGTRYVAAWLRLWWARWDGTDPLADVHVHVPWTITPGRAVAAGHRQSWHCTFPIIGPAIANEAALLAQGKRYGIASPISGTWRAQVTSNAAPTDADLFAGLELRAGAPITGDTTTVAYNDHTTAATLSAPPAHGGSGVVVVGHSNPADQPIAALITVSVTP